MVAELSQVGRVIHDFRRALAPHDEMLTSFEPVGMKFFGPEFSYHARTVLDAYQRVGHTLNTLRDSLYELRETNNSLLSTKQNEIMRTFTVMTFLFLPLTFIAAVFTMHSPNIPIIQSDYGFWIVLGIMATVATSCLFYFKHKGWL